MEANAIAGVSGEKQVPVLTDRAADKRNPEFTIQGLQVSPQKPQ